MFTGLVGYLGAVVTVEPGAGGSRIDIDGGDGLAGELAVGDSIAVNGT